MPTYQVVDAGLVICEFTAVTDMPETTYVIRVKPDPQAVAEAPQAVADEA